MRMIVGVAVLIVLASSCGDACPVPPPCRQQRAFDVTVATAGATAIPGLEIAIAGPSGRTSCASTGGAPPKSCIVLGSRGVYQLSISAPGFRSIQQTVEVTSQGTPGPCTCGVPNTQHLSFTLTPG